jgi:hypothetical protein
MQRLARDLPDNHAVEQNTVADVAARDIDIVNLIEVQA